jgi:hypothetical protein
MNTPTSPDVLKIEQTYFKPVEGGHLFETPNPWIFAPGHRYIVTNEQKLALLEIMRPRHPIRRVVLISAALIVYAAGVSILWWAMSPRDNPGAVELIGMAVTILVPLYLLLVIQVRRHLHRIGPIVSAAVPTEAKMTASERYMALGAAVPTKWLVAGIVIWVLSATTSVISIVTHAGNRSWLSQPMLNVVVTSVLAFFALYQLYSRWRKNT